MRKLITEYNREEEDDNDDNNRRNYFYNNRQKTEAHHYREKSQAFNFFFLDYAFRQKRNSILKVKNKVNLNNYCYELENTISLNIEILLTFLDNSKTNNNKKIVISNDNKSRDTSDTISTISPFMLIKLIKSINEKFKRKAEMTKNKNELVKRINDKIYENKKISSKLKKEKNEFKQKLYHFNKSLDNKDNYLILMNKKFYNFQKHIDNITKNNEKNLILKKRSQNIYDIIFTNISMKKKIKIIKNDMKKYYCEVTELKTDNELFKEELFIRNNIQDQNLIRCMEFYRRINMNILYDIKKLKVSFKRIVKILDFLNLGYIANFSKKKQENEGNCEIEFSKLNKIENNLDVLSKINKNFNISFSFE